MQNNTTGASIYELSELIEADSLGSLNNKLKLMDAKAQQRAEQEHQRAKELQQQEAEAKKQELHMDRDWETK